MLVYYTYIDKNGEKLHRFDEVMDINDVFDGVAKNDEILIQLIKLPAILNILQLTKTKKLKDREVAELCHQLATYLDGGVDLLNIFKDIQVEPLSRNMRNVVIKISEKLNEGESLSAAMSQTKALPDIVITLVEIGERSGQISQALKDAAMYMQRSIALRSSTYRALIYPIFTLSIMLIGFVFWVGFVIPQVVSVIKTMDIDLPIQTEILMIVSSFFQDYWLVELLTIVAIAVFFFVGRRIPFIRYYLDKLWWYFPVTGKVIVSSQMAFYFNYFKVLYDAGVPISDILKRLQRSAPNQYFRKAIAVSNRVIKEGHSLQYGYEESGLFEKMAIRVISAGEQSGSLEKQLDLLGKTYLNRVQVFVETLPKVLEPVFITIIGILFVLFASTLLGPLYEVILQLGDKL